MAVSSVTHNKPVLPRTTDGSDLGSNRASIYSGKGLSFDGVNDYVEVSSPLMFNKHTYLGWYYRDSASNDDCLFDNRDANDDGVRALLTNGGNIFYQLNDTDVYTSFNESGKWMFLAFTYDGTTASIYYNGELFYSASVSETFSVTTNMKLGDSTYESRLWGGDMSDFKAFNLALTASQIKELYNNPELVVPTGVANTSLFMHLPMTEGSGYVLHNANANAIGTELISNAGFDETCQKWGTTDSSTVEIAGGKAIWTNAPLSGSFVEQPLDLEVGKFYRVKFDYTSTAFNIFVNLGDTQQAVPLGNGTFVYDMYYGSGSSSLKFKHGWTTNSSATVDNVSVKEVVPNFYNGTINGATWVNKLPEPLPQTALMDWNKATNRSEYSEDLTQSAWTKNGVTASEVYTDNPLGGTNGVFNVVPSTTSAIHLIQDGGYPVANGSYYVASAWFKSNGYRYAFLSFSGYTNWTGSNGAEVLFDLQEGTATPTGGVPYDYGIEAYPNGWYKCYTIAQATTSFSTNVNFFVSNITTSTSFSGDGVSGLYMFGLQTQISTSVGTYVPTFANIHTSPVLIQEGSTAGKDVFGNTISKPRALGAYNFDGASYVQGLNTGYLPTGDEARSLEVWVYRKYKSTTQSLLEIGSGASSNQRFGILVPTGGALYLVGQGNDNNFTGFSIPEDEWTHIVATHDGTTLKVYRNGVLNNSVSETYATIDVGYRIGLENRSTSTTSLSGCTEYSVSQVSNPRIYNYALTAEQVADNYNEKASTFGGTKVASELDAYIERTASDGATVEAHSCLVNYLTELDKK